MSVYAPLATFLDAGRPQPPADRRARLEEIASYLREADQPALLFVCTHNSRRSQIAQLWARAAAEHFGLRTVGAFSGGTEATAFHPHAVNAMRAAGFRIERQSDGDNPVYRVTVGDSAAPLEAFSKRFDAAANPREDFCAVMVCAAADAGCPFVPGAKQRVSLPFDDPKDFDGAADEAAAYARACREIGAEVAWAVRSAAGR